MSGKTPDALSGVFPLVHSRMGGTGLGKFHYAKLVQYGMPKQLWQILVPAATNDKKHIPIKHHRKWDTAVKIVLGDGGMTIHKSAKGKWLSPDGKLFKERMIPVTLMCTEAEINEIARFTALHYQQEAVMFYLLSTDVRIVHYPVKKSSKKKPHSKSTR